MRLSKEERTRRDTEARRRWKEANPERDREAHRRWAAANPNYYREWYRKNKESVKKSAKKWRDTHPESMLKTKRTQHLRRKYNMSLEDFEALWVAQKGLCAMCNAPMRRGRGAHVEHNHATGKVRGLTHPKCNTIIGYLENSPMAIQQGLRYLEQHK